ncbi:MAG TPA: hypothetical protein VHX38_32675 [Pseudonocardiaceae bacterium]|nr:hypothetical protein [Pseudonocardiaceae bacterium]
MTVSDITWEHVVPTFPVAHRNPPRDDLLAKFHQFVTGFSAINGDVAEHNRITTRPRYVPAELDAGLLVPGTAAIKDKLGTVIEDELFANDLGHS